MTIRTSQSATATMLSSAAFVLTIAATPALAGNVDPVMIEPAPVTPVAAPAAAPAFVFSLRGGVATAPEYFGSDEYTVGPDFGFRFHALRLGGLEFGDPDPLATRRGLSFRGSFRYVDEIDTSEYDELDGLDDVDATYELGGGVSYGGANYMVFADARYGIGGHESWVAELGGDIIARPTEKLSITFGPRFLLGDDGYADTYFSVDDDEAGTLDAYDADGGLITAGVELGARYQFNQDWGIESALTYDKFVNDAADSPIVEAGSDEQWGLRIGITRRFTIGAF